MKISRMMLTGLLAVSLTSSAAAQEVTVDGWGYDRDGAIRDASRAAVERVVGTFIDSRTLMEQLVIQLDEVYKKSQGFVKKITVLDEGAAGNGDYRVRARIDVDTNPDAGLMDELTMLMRLNDPRIVVVVLNGWADNNGGVSHNAEVESMLNSRLLELGFNHVIDADQVIKLYDAKFLNNIYEGRRGLSEVNSDNACEFLVLGKSSANVGRVSVPDYRTGQMIDSPLTNAQTKLNIKVIKYDTGDIVGTFITESSSVGSDNTRAVDKGLAQAAGEAADKLAAVFKNFSAKTTAGLRITIVASDYGVAEAVTQELRSLGEVENVFVRSQNGGKLVLEVDTQQKPHVIASRLRSRSQRNIVVENMTNNSLTLRIT